MVWNVLNPTVQLVLDLRTNVFENGLGYSVINIARIAISAIVITEADKSLGSHPKVVRFMRKPFQRYTYT